MNAEWFATTMPYPLDTMTIAMVANPDWPWAEDLRVTEAAERANGAPGDFVCEILLVSEMAVGIVGFRWAEVVTHLATHAAQRFRLTDRGLLRPGFVADIAVLDTAAVTDRSTYTAGRTLAEGVEHVLVNGALVMHQGMPTGAIPGRALRRG